MRHQRAIRFVRPHVLGFRKSHCLKTGFYTVLMHVLLVKLEGLPGAGWDFMYTAVFLQHSWILTYLVPLFRKVHASCRVINMHMINSQEVAFPYPTYRMCLYWEKECECRGEQNFKWKRIEYKINIQSFIPVFVVLCLWERLKVEKKIAGKNVTQDGYFHFHVISWKMRSSIQLFFCTLQRRYFFTELENYG